MTGTYKHSQGTSFIDVLISIALLALIFWGIFGVFQLALELVGNSRAKAGALALANERMEFLRSLSYDSVGTVGGIPSGNIAQTETVVLNSLSYTRRTFIQFVDAPEDGIGALDSNGITADYKVAKVELSWNTRSGIRQFSLISTIVPKNIETVAGGGTLLLNTIDAFGLPVANALVRVQNFATTPTIDVTTFSNINGQVIFPGSPAAGSYQVTVTKNGYSTAQTYDVTTGNPNPVPRHFTIVEGATTAATFAIDSLVSKTIRTLEPIKDAELEDLFNNQSLIETLSQTVVVGGGVTLLDSGSGYPASGSVISNSVTPAYLNQWTLLSWNDTVPVGTAILYQVYFEVSPGVWQSIPDSDLPGNTAGFSTSGVDLTSLATSTYSSVKLYGSLSTNNASSTSSIEDWKLDYKVGPTPISNVAFSMSGAKTIGTDDAGNPIYKYEQVLSTDSNGIYATSTLEWDVYNITIDGTTEGFDISESCDPQPRSLSPGGSIDTDLFLLPHTTNSLLVVVLDGMGAIIPGASVNPVLGLFNQTKSTSLCGQVFFPSLSNGTYNVTISASGYQTEITTADVSGTTQMLITLITP